MIVLCFLQLSTNHWKIECYYNAIDSVIYKTDNKVVGKKLTLALLREEKTPPPTPPSSELKIILVKS